MSTSARLQEWYRSHCDGDWEHAWGVRIKTLDNPGWLVQINLERTRCEDRPFPEVKADRSDTDWIHCRVDRDVEGGMFEGFGGASNLDEILSVFLNWAES
jgi:hypothetical protein